MEIFILGYLLTGFVVIAWAVFREDFREQEKKFCEKAERDTGYRPGMGFLFICTGLLIVSWPFVISDIFD